MSDLKLPGEEKDKKSSASTARFVIWVVAGAFGLYTVLTGVVGLISNG